MSAYERYTCENCGTDFAAVDGSKAAANGYCSPRCESAGKGYA